MASSSTSATLSYAIQTTTKNSTNQIKYLPVKSSTSQIFPISANFYCFRTIAKKTSHLFSHQFAMNYSLSVASPFHLLRLNLFHVHLKRLLPSLIKMSVEGETGQQL